MELTTLCRTCFISNSETKNIFEIEKVGSVDFVQVLLECTSIQVTKDDVLPQSMCVTCINSLLNYYTFRQKCIETQERILQYLKDIRYSPKQLQLVTVTTKKNNKLKYDYSSIKNSADNQPERTNIKRNLRSNPIYTNRKTKNSIKAAEPPDDYKTEIKFEYPDKMQDLCVEEIKLEPDNETENNNEYLEFVYHDSTNNTKSEPEDENVVDDSKSSNELEKEETFSEDEFFKTSEIKLRDLTCICCNKKFTLESNLREHMKQVHDKDYKYLCHICGYTASRRDTWKGHIDRKHNPKYSELKYVCPKCSKKFASKMVYRRHVATVHSDSRKFSCHLCPAQFKSRCACNKHISSVHSDKTYSCTFCSKRFNRMDNLKQHIRIHTGERPHKCEICGEDFLYTQLLRAHLKTHKIHNK